MENSSFQKLAGISGILSAVLYILSIIGLQYYISASISDMEAFTQNIVDSHLMMMLYGWPGIVATILIFPLVYHFHRNNQLSSELSKMFFIKTGIGLILIVIAYLFHLALTYFHAPMFLELDSSQQAIFSVVIESTVGLQDMFWLGGDLFAFLGIGLILLLGLQEGNYPSWATWLGISAGFLAAIGSFSFIPAFKTVPGLSFLFIAGFSLFAIWEIIAGVLILKAKRVNIE